ncbi:MAG: hypothetical protein RIC55_09430 [Pirellulaceae bacterium]
MIAQEVPSRIGLKYVTGQGRAYSEVLSEEIGRGHFVERMCNNEILRLAAKASDAPKNAEGDVKRPALMSLLEKELKLLWGDLTKDLPVGDGGPFERAMALLWHRMTNMEMVTHPPPAADAKLQGVTLATRASLASKARRLIEKHKAGELKLYSRWEPNRVRRPQR